MAGPSTQPNGGENAPSKLRFALHVKRREVVNFQSFRDSQPFRLTQYGSPFSRQLLIDASLQPSHH